MTFLLDILNLVTYFPFLKVDEEDIGRNMEQLKKYKWFQKYLKDEKTRNLLIHNQKVRETVGKFKTKLMAGVSYNRKCERKLGKVLKEIA